MKALKNIVAVLVLTLSIASCKNETQPELKTVVNTATETVVEKAELDPNATYAKAEFTIEGMTCQVGCANLIERKLVKLEGVKSAEVDFENKLAKVEFDDSKQSTNSIETAVTNVADVYKVKDMKTVDAFSSKSDD